MRARKTTTIWDKQLLTVILCRIQQVERCSQTVHIHCTHKNRAGLVVSNVSLVFDPKKGAKKKIDEK